jgi:hypothetical protein
VLLAFAAGGSSSDRKRSRPIRAFSATPHDGQRPCRTLAEEPGRTQPRAAYPRRCSSNASDLPGRNSARSSESARARLVSPAQAFLPRSWPTAELRIPNAAAQTRIVSKARIRLDSRKSVRSFKGIIWVDISEFESFSMGGLVSSAFRVLRRSDVGCHSQGPRFSSGSALGPSHDGIRRMRRTNLQRRPCRKTYGGHQDSKRTRLIHRPAGTSLHRSAEFTFSNVSIVHNSL